MNFSYCSIQELSSELLVISGIISIPILEPLSASRVEKVSQLALACLNVALTVATGNFSLAGAAGMLQKVIVQLLLNHKFFELNFLRSLLL